MRGTARVVTQAPDRLPLHRPAGVAATAETIVMDGVLPAPDTLRKQCWIETPAPAGPRGSRLAPASQAAPRLPVDLLALDLPVEGRPNSYPAQE
jgi:hypothetical protein